MQQDQVTIGLISDTYGLLRPEAIAALGDSDLIVHPGDVGRPDVLEALPRIAPTTAVRGNNDKGPWAEELPETEVVVAGSHYIYVLHELSRLDLDSATADFTAVITGHTHHPTADIRKGVLYLDPGSAGPRRFTLPVSIAKIRIVGNEIEHELIELSE